MGSTRALVELSGARTYVGSGDEDSAAGRNELQWTNEFNISYDGAFEPDVIIHDGDRINIGDKRFSFIASPGHTRGVLSIFFNVTESGKEYRAGMFGGAGVNQLKKAYLDKKGMLPLSWRADYLASLERLRGERVEVFVGNHSWNNRTREKFEQMQADPTVIYGMGRNFSGRLLFRHLEDEKNLYNTYRHGGLPPGPICSFGAAALEAAKKPEDHKFLYFVATGKGGGHKFSKSLKEHNRAVQEYRAVMRQKK